MTELNIEIICADSPQAKGRVERSNMVACQAYLPEFRQGYNRRFAPPPRNAHDAHRPLQMHERLDDIFTIQDDRRVSDEARITRGGQSPRTSDWRTLEWIAAQQRQRDLERLAAPKITRREKRRIRMAAELTT